MQEKSKRRHADKNRYQHPVSFLQLLQIKLHNLHTLSVTANNKFSFIYRASIILAQHVPFRNHMFDCISSFSLL